MSDASPSANVQAKVSLREVSAKTVRDICELSVAPGQERFVAPNSVSIAEAYFCENAWFRAIKLPGALNLAIHEPHNHVDRTICSNFLANKLKCGNADKRRRSLSVLKC